MVAAIVHYETKGPHAKTMLVNADTGEVLTSEPTAKGSLERAARRAMRRGITINHVEVFDWEWIMTQDDAERRAREVWGDNAMLVTRVSEVLWWVQLTRDHRAHLFDNQGTVVCKHADCLKENGQ